MKVLNYIPLLSMIQGIKYFRKAHSCKDDTKVQEIVNGSAQFKKTYLLNEYNLNKHIKKLKSKGILCFIPVYGNIKLGIAAIKKRRKNNDPNYIKHFDSKLRYLDWTTAKIEEKFKQKPYNFYLSIKLDCKDLFKNGFRHWIIENQCTSNDLELFLKENEATLNLPFPEAMKVFKDAFEKKGNKAFDTTYVLISLESYQLAQLKTTA